MRVCTAIGTEMAYRREWVVGLHVERLLKEHSTGSSWVRRKLFTQAEGGGWGAGVHFRQGQQTQRHRFWTTRPYGSHVKFSIIGDNCVCVWWGVMGGGRVGVRGKEDWEKKPGLHPGGPVDLVFKGP